MPQEEPIDLRKIGIEFRLTRMIPHILTPLPIMAVPLTVRKIESHYEKEWQEIRSLC